MDRSGGDLSALVLHQSRRREPFRLDFVAGDHKGWQGKKEEARGGSMRWKGSLMMMEVAMGSSSSCTFEQNFERGNKERKDDDGGSDRIEFVWICSSFDSK